MADPKQIERLAKVRRLARENPSEGEGAAARTKLVELMAKHGVTDMDMDLFGARSAPLPVHAPSPFQGSFVVEIMPGSMFGQVFGFGFGFGVNVTSGTSSTSSTTGW